jgi:hypothetical protein
MRYGMRCAVLSSERKCVFAITLDEKEKRMKPSRCVTVVLVVFALIVTAAGQVPAQDVDCTEKFLRHGAECTRPPGSPYGCQIWDILSYNSNREVAILSSSYSDNTFSARIESTDASGNKSVCVQTETLRLQEEWRISGTRIESPTRLRVNLTGPASLIPGPGQPLPIN